MPTLSLRYLLRRRSLGLYVQVWSSVARLWGRLVLTYAITWAAVVLAWAEYRDRAVVNVLGSILVGLAGLAWFVFLGLFVYAVYGR